MKKNCKIDSEAHKTILIRNFLIDTDDDEETIDWRLYLIRLYPDEPTEKEMRLAEKQIKNHYDKIDYQE